MDLQARSRLEHYYARVLAYALTDLDAYMARIDAGRKLQRQPLPWRAPPQDLAFLARLSLRPSPAGRQAVRGTNVLTLKRTRRA